MKIREVEDSVPEVQRGNIYFLRLKFSRLM